MTGKYADDDVSTGMTRERYGIELYIAQKTGQICAYDEKIWPVGIILCFIVYVSLYISQ